MKHIRKITPAVLVLFLSGIFLVSAQEIPPKYEFRAVWIATVANIDWPLQPGLTVSQQKDDAIRILDHHQAAGINAIIFQIRPAADAFYPSELEPWSRYLSGIPGKGPEPFYDPLQFWIDECHKRKMELHAWFNPYRVAQRADEPLAGNHIAFRHPEWILLYGDKLYFDPGLPETREFTTKVILDVVRRYDIDAVHFDDYFYPYPLEEDFPDTASFAIQNRGFRLQDKGDWRRENVDIIIKMLNDSIKSVKPWVKFGISPFGVWRNKTDDLRGSETTAWTTNYDRLYADILKWLEKGWIDYVLPQLYWPIGHRVAEYSTLAAWWSKNTFGRGLYIGHAVYQINGSSAIKEWTQPDQLPRQLRILRSLPGITGSAFFSSKHFDRDLMGFQDSLTTRFYRYPAIIPPMPWIDNSKPFPVRNIRKSGKTIRWDIPKTFAEMDKPSKFIIYMNEAGTAFCPDDPRYIKSIILEDEYRFNLTNPVKKKYEIRISALDRLNNESELSKPITIKL